THFSFSQMQNYEKCPLKYKFGNVLKIPTKGSHYFSFGSTIHNTLQKYLEQCIGNAQPDLFSENKGDGKMTVLPLKKLLEIYDASWIDDWYDNSRGKEKYRQKGKELLNTFHEQFSVEKPAVRMLEHKFHVKIGGYMFSGRIDRIDDVADGKVEIIDYKTGGSPKGGKLETDDRRQLLLYQIVAESVLKQPVEKLTYYYLEEGKRLSFVGKDKDKVALEERFVNDIGNIKAQKFEPTPSEHVCKYCEYRDICEYKKI
ncbi:MAG: PD-(D/E)XK nuclease family protein, partial [Parcubacteria group bacterium]